MNTADKETRAKINALRTKMNTAMQNYNNFYRSANLGKYGKGVQTISTGMAKKVAIISGIAIVAIFIILCVTGVIPIGKAIKNIGTVKKASQGDINAANALTDTVNAADKSSTVDTVTAEEAPATDATTTETPAVEDASAGADPTAGNESEQLLSTASTSRVLSQAEIQDYAQRTIKGEFGNGPARTAAWTQEGISPEQQNQIQALVNKNFVPKPAPAKPQGSSIVDSANQTDEVLASKEMKPIGSSETPVGTVNKSPTDATQPATENPAEKPAAQPATGATTGSSYDADGADCKLAVKFRTGLRSYMTNSIVFSDGMTVPAITTSGGPTYTSIYDSNGRLHIYMYRNGDVIDTNGQMFGADSDATAAIMNIADKLQGRR